MLKEIIISIQAYGRAHDLIKQHRLWKWILLPGILYALMFMTSMYFFAHTSNNFFEWLNQKTSLNNWIKKEEVGLLGFVTTMSSLILWVIIMQLYYSLFKFFFLIIGSPIFAYLSEKTAAILNNEDLPFSFKLLLEDIFRGIWIAARNSVWQTVYVIAIIFFCLLPLLGWCTPLLALMIECYYYGFSMVDYSMKRNHKNAAESIFFIGRHKGLALGNGMVFYIMHLLPFVGWVLAPAYSVIAATLSIVAINSDTTTIKEPEIFS